MNIIIRSLSLPLGLIAAIAFPLGAQTPASHGGKSESGTAITLLDGTPVTLRFAQPLVGVPQYRVVGSVNHARKNDVVRLVVASDVRVNGMLVVRKGSVAQATVMKAVEPNWQYEDSGLELRFDWVESLNGQQVPLKHKQNGKKPGKFTVLLMSTKSGHHLLTGFSWKTRGLRQGIEQEMKVKTHHQWTVVPTGTRVTAYVYGDTALDSAAIQKALADLPVPNPTATVTIFREKGPRDQQPRIFCDHKELAILEESRYLATEMEPGKHICEPEKGESTTIQVSAGEEVYLKLHHVALSGKWLITEVDAAAGEDAITFLTLIGTTQPEAASSSPSQPASSVAPELREQKPQP